MKTKNILLTAIAALFWAVFMSGCKDEKVGKTGVCPSVVSTSPANLATNVPLDQIVTITFNEAMDPATITQAAFTLVKSGSAGDRIDGTTRVEISGTLTYDSATFTMSFTPSTKLESGTTYTGTIATLVKDLMGNSLQVDHVWTFSTGVYPTVVSTEPLDNAKSVLLNKVVTATFNVAMDPLTITSTTFNVKQGTTVITGAVSYDGLVASFTPSSPLTPSTIYTATITIGAKNIAGTSLVNDYVWNFNTGTCTCPTVLSTDPLNLETGVTLNKVVSAFFNEALDPLTITSSTFTLMNGSTPVAGTINYSGTTATFTPTSNLLPGQTYTATFTTGVKNIAGVPLTNEYVWTFSTQ